jgi:hypothetical protein
MTLSLQDDSYKNLFADVKTRIQQAQTKAVIAVNKELLLLYWEIGSLVLDRQSQE